MQTLTVNSVINIRKKTPKVPVTGRGRALYTLDWFLNGNPVLTNHDNPRLTIKNGIPCC